MTFEGTRNDRESQMGYKFNLVSKRDSRRRMEEQKNKLYVGNLPYTISDEQLGETFAAAGEVEDAKVITDKFSGRSKGFGFVTMKDEKAAEKAIKDLDGKEVDGRPLKVNVARPMRERRE